VRIFGDRQVAGVPVTSSDQSFCLPETATITGKLELKDFPNLE
jgi:hypothetical protein